MSKLAHSNQETMDEIDRRRAIEDGNEDMIGKPEMGDTVEFKTRGEYGGVITMRGEVVGIQKNGKIKIRPEDDEGKTYYVEPEHVFVLRKGE